LRGFPRGKNVGGPAIARFIRRDGHAEAACNFHLFKGTEMPKMKTKSSAKKRFSKTGSGKIKRNFAFKRHCLEEKPTKMKRKARGTTILAKQDEVIVRQFMPYL
jgi:large subunit ribosomal protein L35